MTAYIGCFLVTCLLIASSEKSRKQNHKRAAFCLGLFAVVILSTMAGIRSYQVGTDIRFYILPGYYQAKSYLGNFFTYLKNDKYQLELMYLILEYISASIFQSPHFVMFILSLITNLFVYAGIVNMYQKISMPLAWAVFCFVYFNVSLNLMRQSVSVAIIFYLFSYGERLNLKKVITLVLLATIFHISGLIGFFLYVVYSLIGQRNRLSGTKWVMFIICLSLPVVILYMIQILSMFGFFSGKYLIYIGNQGEIALGNIIFRFMGFLSFFIYYLSCRKYKHNIDQLTFLMYVGIINILLLYNNSLVFTRIGKFFEIFQVIYFPWGMSAYSKIKGLKTIFSILLILLILFYWYYQFIFLNIGATYPYKIDSNLFKAV